MVQGIVLKAFDLRMGPITFDLSALLIIKKGTQIFDFYIEKVNKGRDFFAHKSNNDFSNIL